MSNIETPSTWIVRNNSKGLFWNHGAWSDLPQIMKHRKAKMLLNNYEDQDVVAMSIVMAKKMKYID